MRSPQCGSVPSKFVERDAGPVASMGQARDSLHSRSLLVRSRVTRRRAPHRAMRIPERRFTRIGSLLPPNETPATRVRPRGVQGNERAEHGTEIFREVLASSNFVGGLEVLTDPAIRASLSQISSGDGITRW